MRIGEPYVGGDMFVIRACYILICRLTPWIILIIKICPSTHICPDFDVVGRAEKLRNIIYMVDEVIYGRSLGFTCFYRHRFPRRKSYYTIFFAAGLDLHIIDFARIIGKCFRAGMTENHRLLTVFDNLQAGTFPEVGAVQ